MENDDGVHTSNSSSGETEREARSFRQDAQNDNNDPAKLQERLARLQADFQNARKRSLREQQQFREYAEFDITEALLPVLDSL